MTGRQYAISTIRVCLARTIICATKLPCPSFSTTDQPRPINPAIIPCNTCSWLSSQPQSDGSGSLRFADRAVEALPITPTIASAIKHDFMLRRLIMCTCILNSAIEKPLKLSANFSKNASIAREFAKCPARPVPVQEERLDQGLRKHVAATGMLPRCRRGQVTCPCQPRATRRVRDGIDWRRPTLADMAILNGLICFRFSTVLDDRFSRFRRSALTSLDTR